MPFSALGRMITRICSQRFARYASIVRFSSAQPLVAVTGIKPTGIPHLGNYLGMIRPCVDLQKSGKLSAFFILIADLHALTSSSAMRPNNLDLAATLVASFQMNASDDDSCVPTLFLQSTVRGHTELAWILANTCSMPRLSHLPQWRDKSGLALLKKTEIERYEPNDRLSELSQTVETSCSVGLFTYPVLQAADILLYGGHLVPVGSDQTTHIELARDLVRSATSKWPDLANTLVLPSAVSIGVPKINCLRNPQKKMSKSDQSTEGTIYLTDDADVIRRKVKRAVTDSLRRITYDADQRPGVSNLLRILAALQRSDLDTILDQASRWDKETLKSHVTDNLIQHLSPLRMRIEALKGTVEGRKLIRCEFDRGSAVANRLAEERLAQIYSAIGCGLPSLDEGHQLLKDSVRPV